MRFLLYLFLLFTGGIGLAQSPYTRGTVYLDGETSLSIGNLKRIAGQNFWGSRPPLETNGLEIASVPVGVFAFNRILVGARIGYFYNWYGENFFDGSIGNDHQYQVNPFLRYYILAGAERKWNLFAEVGYGSLASDNPSTFQGEFHLGAGVDLPLWPGVLGSARLAYNASKEINFTTLDIRGNILLGQLGTPTGPSLTKGSWTTRGALASASLNHMRRGNDRWTNHTYSLHPTIGYFLADGLLVSNTSIASWYIMRNITQLTAIPVLDDNFHSLDFATEFETRYYPWRRGRFLPFGAAALGYGYYETLVFTEQGIEVEPEHSTHWRAAAGVSYFLGQHVALEVSAAYQREGSRRTADDLTLPAIKFRRIALQTGFAFYFGRKT